MDTVCKFYLFGDIQGLDALVQLEDNKLPNGIFELISKEFDATKKQIDVVQIISFSIVNLKRAILRMDARTEYVVGKLTSWYFFQVLSCD